MQGALRTVAVIGVGVTLSLAALSTGSGSASDDEGSLPVGEIVFTRLPADGAGRVDDDARPDLYVVRPDGANLRLLVRNGSDAAVSPDGRLVAFVRNGAIWVMRRNTSGQHAVTKPLARQAPGYRPRPVDDRGPAWSPNSRTIYFSRWVSKNETESLYRVGRDGATRRRLTAPEPAYDGHCHSNPSPSPTGRVIAFEEWFDCNTGADISINAITSAGRPARLRFSFPDVDVVAEPAWSPRGQLIAFSTMYLGEEPGHPDGLYLSSSDGSAPRRVAHTGSQDGSPAWAPEGAWIAFTRAISKPSGYPGDIWLVRQDGTATHRVTSGAPDDGDPTWLPPAS